MRYSVILGPVLALAVSAGAQGAALERVVVGVHPGFTRIVFHLDEATPYSVAWGADGAPVILLQGLGADGAAPAAPSFTQEAAPLTGISYRPAADGLEAVLGVNGPVSAKDFALTPDSYGGHRVVIDLESSGLASAKVAPEPENNQQAPETPAVIALAPEPEPEPEPSVAQAMPGPKAPLTPSVSAAYPDPVKDESPVCATYTKALDENQWDMDALITYGACLSNSGALSQAAAAFERILSFDPDFHRARLNLAKVYVRQGKTARAEAAYKYVLLSGPPADVVRVIQAALHDLSSSKVGPTAQK